MARLELRFFGTPRCRLDVEPVHLDRRKAEALLAYLVLEPREHRRSELAVLLWPELSRARGRAALRRALRTLTAALGASWLEVGRRQIAVRSDASIECDVTAFEKALGRGELEEAVALYQNDFLSDLTLADAEGFDAWQRSHAERLRDELAHALAELVERYHRDGADDRALAYAERWMMLDPLDERAHRCAIEILASAGRRGAALRIFEAFSLRLENELGIEPSPSLLELLRQNPTFRVNQFDETTKAWRAACTSRRVDIIDAELDRVSSLADRRGLYRDGIALLDDALLVVHEGSVLGRVLSRQAGLYACIGQLTKARALLEASLRIATSEREMAFCENRLGGVLFAEGSYSRSRRYLRSSAARYRRAEDAAGLAWTLNVLGHLSAGTRAAPKLLYESLERSRRAKDEPRIASTLNSLGKDAYVRRDLVNARRRLEQSLELRRALGHRIGVADSLNNLGNVLVGFDETSRARRAFEEALGIAEGIQARPLIAEILIGLASLRHALGEPEPAAHFAAAAYYLPGAWQDAKDHASEWLAVLSTNLSRRALERATNAGKDYRIG